MAQGSSLPPLKTNQGKYGIVALLLLLAAGGLWYFMGVEDSESKAEVPEPEPTPAPRAQFAAEIEMPDDGGLEEGEAGDLPSQKPGTERRTVQCGGTLQAAQIRAVINGQPRKQVQTCYEQRLKDNNLLQGSMTVLLTIAPSGDVQSVSVSGSLKDPQVYTCVKRVARTWKFPKPEGGCVQTAIPFMMTPKL